MSDVPWKRILNGPKQAGFRSGLVATVAFAVGGLLLLWSGYIHFHLWDSEGYRHIATIGPLFLLQSIAALLLAVLVIAARRVWAAVLGAGFALSTVAGFLLSVEIGLFGFKDSWQAPFANQAFLIELTAVATLVVAGAICAVGSAGGSTAAVSPATTSSGD
jgi:hypothetical protein